MIKNNIKQYKNTLLPIVILEVLIYIGVVISILLIIVLVSKFLFQFPYFDAFIQNPSIFGFIASFDIPIIIFIVVGVIVYIKSIWIIEISEEGITLINTIRQKKLINWNEINHIGMTRFGQIFKGSGYGIILNKTDREHGRYFPVSCYEIDNKHYIIPLIRIDKKIIQEMINAYKKYKESIKLNNITSQSIGGKP